MSWEASARIRVDVDTRVGIGHPALKNDCNTT
jgi:hypothetical protein